MSAHERLFRWLCRVYPIAFRREYGDEMAALFAARVERRRRTGGLSRLWLSTIRDALVTATAEWWGRLGGSPGSPSERERRTSMLERVRQDIGVASRRLARSPVFTLAAILIAALGIGANTSAFALVDALLFRPPPFRDVERVVRIYQDSDDGDPNSSSYPATRDMASFTNVFSGVAAWSPDVVTMDAEEGPRREAVEYVTASYLPVLGLEPSIGRWFEAAYDQVGAGAYAVLSHTAWRSQFDADPGVVGRTIRLNGQPVTVIGVGPASFNGSNGVVVTDIWLSISSAFVGGGFRVANLERREDHWYQTWARLAPGVTLPQAQSAMDALATRLAEDFPELNRGRGITVYGASEIRVHPGLDAQVRSAGSMLMVVVGLVLILACSNLGGLFLVRGMARSPELAVRRALGASRGRVLTLLLTEALLLSVAGGAAGLLLARWVLQILPNLPIPLPVAGRLELAIDQRVLAFTLILILATGALFGLLPALRAAGVDLAPVLRRDMRSSAHRRRVPLLRNGLLVVQVAVSLILLVGSGLLVHSLVNLSTLDAGVDADRIAYIGVAPGQAGMTGAQATTSIEAVRARLSAVPGVTGVALASRLPAQNRGGTSTIVVDGYDPPNGTGSVELTIAYVSPEYFETLGIPVLAGRAFETADLTSEHRILIVNETAAHRFWTDRDAVGGRMRSQGAPPDRWTEVIGVVGDSKVRTLGETATPLIYLPMASVGTASYVLVHTSADATSMLGSLRSEMRAAEPALPITILGTLDDHFHAGLASPRLATRALASFSLIALLLTAIGIYAVLSFSVARRTSELGIRMALGAAWSRVILAVVGEVLAAVVVGVAAGFGLAAVLAQRVQGMLFGVGGLDPAAFVGAASMLVLVAAIAAFLPSRRAVGIDPVDALRAEV